MPEIPQSDGPRVRTAPLPAPLANPRIASPDVYGAGIGEGISRGGVMAARAYEEAEERRDDIEAADAYNRFAEEDHAAMTALRSRTGGNARGLLDDATADYRKRQEAVSKNLKRPGAQEKFRQMTDHRWSSRNSAILGEHQAEQLRRYESNTLDGMVKTAQLDALDIGTDEALIEADRRASITLDRKADLEGTDPQTRDLQQRHSRDTLFGAAIANDIEADDWKTAKARLDKFGGTMSEGLRRDLDRKIREGGRNQTAQDTVDTIFRSGYANTKADVDRMVAVEKDADLRQRIQTKADQEWARREEHVRVARSAAYKEIASAVDGGASAEAMIAKHENAAALTQEDKDHLRLIEDRRAKRQAPPAGSPAYYALRQSASMLPEHFKQVDLELMRGVISEPERMGLIELQADMLGRPVAGSSGRKPSSLLTVSDIAARSLRTMEINGGMEKGERDPRADAFERLFDRAIEASGGTQNLTNAQMQEIADRLMAEEVRDVAAGGVGKWVNMLGLGLPGMVAGVGIDGTEKVRAFEQPGAADRAFSYQQIPESFRLKAEAQRDKNGKPPTAQMILNAYNASLGR